MIILENNIEKIERELLKTSSNNANLYDPAHFSIIKELSFTENGNTGIFKAFTYKNSLRFSVLVRENPCLQMIDWLVGEIRLSKFDEPYHFFLFRLERNEIETNVNMKGLTARQCTSDMIDICIDIMEDVFTPFPDSPGSFRNDKERITADFLHDRGGATLFYKDDDLIGFCGHKEGHFTEVVVRKEYQGKGYGETIVRAVLKSVCEMGYNAELTTGHYNDRAITLYEKVGFRKVYESMRVTLPHII